MKKITLLFATMLAMSGMGFGQKEGKVLWETLVDKANSGLKIANYGINPAVSPTGNILVQYKYASPLLIGNENLGVKAFNKNGKEMWNANDFYKRYYSIFEVGSPMDNHVRINSFYTDSKNGQYYYDSTLYFDGEYRFLKKLMVLDNRAFIAPAENGILYSSEFEKATIKYDLNGKEEWRYPSSKGIVFQTWGEKKTPYLGIVPMTDGTGKSRYVILDKDGKQKGFTEPQFFTAIYRNNDNGFWSRNEKYEFIKFDSTGKQTFILPLDSQWSRDNFALSDNSLLLQSENKNSLNLILVLPEGKVKYVSFSFPFQVNYATNFKCKEVAPNVIMYAFGMPEREIEADIIYKIGVVNFNDPSKSWSKDIRGGASNGIDGNAFTFEAGNTFFQAYSDPNQPLRKTFKAYDISGNLKWESPFVSMFSTRENTYKIVGDYLYTQALYESPQGFAKVRMTDGKIIWSKLSPTFSAISIQDYRKNIQIDKNGNDVIMYTQRKSNDVTEPYRIRISVLNADGTEKWFYKLAEFKPNEFAQASFYQRDTQFAPTDDGKLIVLSQETKDNKQQYILRKISPCEDLLSTVTASATEACPTEKVKLSVQKQDGVTYQWQKDGVDIPNFKDAVYDFGESGTYTVKVKDEICQNQATSNALKINIRSLPNAEIKTTKTTFCEGDKTTINATTNGVFFQWQKDQKDIPNATSGILDVSEAGNYRVGVRDDK